MRDLDSADDLEQLAGKMRRRTDTGARVIELVRIGLCTRDEGGDRIDLSLGSTRIAFGEAPSSAIGAKSLYGS
jgi:hypothetical protein